MMMDDLTQEEIKIIMDLRKVEIDNKIKKIDKEKMSVFISLYLRKKQKKAEMEDLTKKYTEIQDIIKKEHDDIGTELVNSCVHYAHTKGRIYYDECFQSRDFYYCPACDKKIHDIHKYTNVWDEDAIIKIFKETKGEPIKDDPIKDDPIKDDPIKDDPIKDDPIKSYLDGNMTNEEITNKINTHKYNYNLLRIMLEMPETIYIYSDSD
jgi:hypothetical protein